MVIVLLGVLALGLTLYTFRNSIIDFLSRYIDCVPVEQRVVKLENRVTAESVLSGAVGGGACTGNAGHGNGSGRSHGSGRVSFAQDSIGRPYEAPTLSLVATAKTESGTVTDVVSDPRRRSVLGRLASGAGFSSRRCSVGPSTEAGEGSERPSQWLSPISSGRDRSKSNFGFSGGDDDEGL